MAISGCLKLGLQAYHDLDSVPAAVQRNVVTGKWTAEAPSLQRTAAVRNTAVTERERGADAAQRTASP